MKNVCADCGTETDQLNGPCAACKGFRIVSVSVAEKHFGKDWKKAFVRVLTTADFKVGQVLEFKCVTKCGTSYSTGVVTAVDFAPGYVTYTGHRVDDRPASGSGAFRPEKVGTTKFGFYVAVKVIGFSRSFKPWSPRPGDTSYDLMC